MLTKRLAGLAALLALSIAAACSSGQSNTTPLVNAAASNAPTLGSTYQTNAVNGMTSYINTSGTGSLSVTASATVPSGATAFARTASAKTAMSANGAPILYYTLTANTTTTVNAIGFVNVTMPNAPSGSTYMATLNGSQWLTVGGLSGKSGTYSNGTLSVPGGALNGKTGVTVNAGQSLYVVVYVGKLIATPSPPPAPSPSVASISVPPGQSKSLEVKTGADVTLKAASSDSTIAQVNASATAGADGAATFTITGVKRGTATITFTDPYGLTGSASVIVSNAPVPNMQTAVLSPGSVTPLNVTTESKSVTATTSDATVLTVSPASPTAATPDPASSAAPFTVTAVGPGKATITFTDSNGNTATFTGIVSNIRNGAFTNGLANWSTCSFNHAPFSAPQNEATPVPVALPSPQTATTTAITPPVPNALATPTSPPANDNPQLPAGVGPTAPPVLGSTVALIGTLDASVVAEPTGAFGLCQSVAVSSNTPNLWFWVWEGGSQYNFKSADAEADVIDQSGTVHTLYAEQHCYINPTNHLGAPGAFSTSGCWPPPGGDTNNYKDWIGGGFWMQRGPFNLSAYTGQNVTLYFGNWASSGGNKNYYAQFIFLGDVQMLPVDTPPTLTPLAGRHALTIQLHR